MGRLNGFGIGFGVGESDLPVLVAAYGGAPDPNARVTDDGDSRVTDTGDERVHQE